MIYGDLQTDNSRFSLLNKINGYRSDASRHGN